MAQLETTYMGLELKNPLIASSSGITGSLDGVMRVVEAGAGAVVLKSMFEELILARSEEIDSSLLESEHPEAYEYLRAELGMQLGPRPYLNFIGDVKGHVAVPVIASVNCTSSKWWVPYAREIERAGADAIELNISHFPQADGVSATDIEKRYADIVAEVTGQVSIPVAVKLGSYFTTLWDTVRGVVDAGARAVVLFNRYYSVDIDIGKREFVPSISFSTPEEITLPLRWVGLMSGDAGYDISATTGVHDTDGVLKMLLAGATTVQVCSTLYLEGAGHLAELVEDLDRWLEDNGYQSVNDIRGLAREKGGRERLLKRLQYLQALSDAANYEW